MSPRLRRSAPYLVSAAVLLWAVFALHAQLRGVDLTRVRAAWQATGAFSIAMSGLCTGASFAVLALLERHACALAAPGAVPARRAQAVGATAHALCNTLGAHALLAPALRLAGYGGYGLSAAQVARVLGVIAAALVLGSVGSAALASVVLAWGAKAGLTVFCIGIALVALAPRLRSRHARVDTGLRHLRVLAALGLVESACALAALYVLLPADAVVAPERYVLAFIGASTLGVLSHAPGGLGVFEAGMLAALPGARHRVLGALLLFRVVYNLLPAVLAALTLLARARRVSSRADTRGSRAAAPGTGAPVR